MRTECLYDNKLIHIADYFTVINGEQIAIEELGMHKVESEDVVRVEMTGEKSSE